jgi:hypothetical protein
MIIRDKDRLSLIHTVTEPYWCILFVLNRQGDALHAIDALLVVLTFCILLSFFPVFFCRA